MPNAMPAQQVLDREFLEIRAKLLELAASFDRLDRGAGSVADDRRTALFQEALSILAAPAGDRAERIQLLFSRSYESDWRDRYDV